MAVSENVIQRPSVIENAARRTSERRFYLAAGLLFPVIILIGFARSYYLKFLFDAPPLPSMLAHLHGAVMTSWVLLFTTQIWLVSARRVKLHMKLGYASIALAVMIVVTGYFTAVAAARRVGLDTEVNGMPAVSFLAIPLIDLITFSLYYGAAVLLRKKAADHKRLMLLTAINFLPPSLGRMQFAAALGPIWFMGVPAVLGLGAVAYDRYRTGKVNKIFLAGVLLMIVSGPLRIYIGGTESWKEFATWLVG